MNPFPFFIIALFPLEHNINLADFAEIVPDVLVHSQCQCHNRGGSFIHYKKTVYEGISLKGYIEERAINIANYIIEENATVRQTAKKFGISKSTVHTVVTK